MEKELLKKIYLLRDVSPREDWKENTKKDILKEEDVASSFVVEPRLLATGVFVLAFAVIFTLPLLSKPEETYVEVKEEKEDVTKEEVTVAQVEEGEEEIKEEEKNEGEVVVAVKEEDPLVRTQSLSEEIRELEKLVLAKMIAEEKEEEGDYTDEELAGHLLAEIEKMSSFQVQVQTEEGSLIEDAREAMEEGRYDDVISIYLRMRR